MISRRGWTLLAATLLFVLGGLFTLNLLILLGGVAAFAAVASELLLFHLPRPSAATHPFELLRGESPRAVSPGTETDFELGIRYRGTRPAFAEVRVLLPSAMPTVGGRTAAAHWWRPGERDRLAYTLRAGVRGSHVIGPVAVCVESPSHLAWAQWSVEGSDVPVRVVPPAPIERAYRIGPALFTRMQGRLALRHRGFGTEFRSLRPYQLSDDIRHVAWKRSRPGQLYVREFEQESRQDYLLLLDITPGMVAGRPGENALDRAIEAGSLVTAAAARSGEDRVGLMTQSGRARQYLKPSRGQHHFRLIAENLAYLHPVEGSFELPAALEQLTRRLATNTHILAFTALDGPLAQFHLAHARFRARGHHLYVFPANRAGFYPPLAEGAPGATALLWAEREEQERLARRVSELRAEGVPVFPYDRRGAAAQVLSTYGQLRAWGLA